MNFDQPSAAVALALGLWNAVQPCPMTSNLAAVAWLGRRAESIGSSIAAAALFLAGQSIAYVGLSWLVLEGVASSWRLSAFLQRHVNELLGPLWILAAMVLLGLIEFRLPRFGRAVSPLPAVERRQAVWLALPLGVLLALAFCPVTAVLFFVNLVTIARNGGSHVVYPLLYAVGAALPVAALAVLLGGASHGFGAVFHRTQQLQWWLNRMAGGVLLAVGVYYSLRFNFGLPQF